jgi:hypothetical protein
VKRLPRIRYPLEQSSLCYELTGITEKENKKIYYR